MISPYSGWYRANRDGLMTTGLWWIKILGLAAASFFFLFLGVDSMIGAYRLTNPLEFIMMFFSTSLMILISMAGIIFVFFRLYTNKKPIPSQSYDSKP